MQGLLKVIGLFQFVSIAAKRIGHDGIENDIGAGDGLAGAKAAELKFIAGKRDGRGTVAVGGVLRNGGQDINADAQRALDAVSIIGVINNGVDDCRQLVAKIDRDNGRGRFLRAKTVIVSGKGHRAAQKSG